jgi:hypothetical protein
VSKRYGFQVSDEEGVRFEEFAELRAAPVGSLAIVAIREYIERKDADRKRSEARRKVAKAGAGVDNAPGQVAGSPGATDSESEEVES